MNFAMIRKLYEMAAEKDIITIENAISAYQRAVDVLRTTKLYQCAPTLIDGLLADESKKLLFLINPPYAGSGSMTNKSGTSAKESISESDVVKLMKDNKFGGTNQLYTIYIQNYMYQTAFWK